MGLWRVRGLRGQTRILPTQASGLTLRLKLGHSFYFFKFVPLIKKKLFKLALANNKADDILLHFIKPPEIFLIDSSIPGQGQFNTGASLCSEASGRNVHSWLRSGDLRRLVKVQFFYSSVYLPII